MSFAPLNTDLEKQDFVYKTIEVEFADYWAVVTHEQLGVEDASQYVWELVPIGNWHYMPFIYGYYDGLLLRCWFLDGTTNSTVSLLEEGTVHTLLKGAKIK